MNRCWPLTAVLLAFWLGRETGAQGGEEREDAKFDVIEARRIKLTGGITIGAFEGRRTVELTSQGIDVVARERATPDQTLTTHIDSQGVHVYETKEEPAGAHSKSTKFKHLATMGGWGETGAKHGFLFIYNRDGQEGISLRTHYGTVGNYIRLCDADGKTRVILGAVGEERPGGAKRVRPESNLSLFDEKGNVVAQLPAKK